jgi:hypothetical protein
VTRSLHARQQRGNLRVTDACANLSERACCLRFGQRDLARGPASIDRWPFHGFAGDGRLYAPRLLTCAQVIGFERMACSALNAPAPRQLRLRRFQIFCAMAFLVERLCPALVAS